MTDILQEMKKALSNPVGVVTRDGILRKGDTPGHAFHGNQYTTGAVGGAMNAKGYREKAKAMKEQSSLHSAQAQKFADRSDKLGAQSGRRVSTKQAAEISSHHLKAAAAYSKAQVAYASGSHMDGTVHEREGDKHAARAKQAKYIYGMR